MSTPVDESSLGPTRLFLSLNGIAPFEDTGMDFTYYRPIPAASFKSVAPTGGPRGGGTPVTVSGVGLAVLGAYAPPATGQAKCRWGEWGAGDRSYRETSALSVSSERIICPTPAASGFTRRRRVEGAGDDLSIAINGQDFTRTTLQVQCPAPRTPTPIHARQHPSTPIHTTPIHTPPRRCNTTTSHKPSRW